MLFVSDLIPPELRRVVEFLRTKKGLTGCGFLIRMALSKTAAWALFYKTQNEQTFCVLRSWTLIVLL